MKQKQVQFHLTAREFTAFSDMTALFQLKNHRIASSRLKNTLFLILLYPTNNNFSFKETLHATYLVCLFR